MNQYKYRFSSSALSKFQNYLDSDKEFEDFWNVDRETGEYKLSLDEIIAKNEQELLDYINKVPMPPIEAADKGTVFNEIVDRILLHTKDGREDVKIKSGKVLIDGDEAPVVFGEMEGFSFTFDLQLCMNIAKELQGAIPQYHTEAILPTKYGPVLLHGYIDYVLNDIVVDLKTTKNYTFPKFDSGWQKDVYPYCLIESGVMENVSEFDYIVVLWKDLVGKPTSGSIYLEPYTYNHVKATARLKEICEWLIEWVEINRERITNKVFLGEE